MKVLICESKQEVNQKAFEVMKEVVVSKHDAVLGLATGSSPIGLYELMIKDHKENGTSYKDVTTFNLDEYTGLARNHSESYYAFMHNNLFNGIDVKEENIHLPLGNGDLEKNCEDYENELKKYHVDIQVLGIGSNGHIGFNEPTTSFDSVTHVVELTENTRKDNARFFDPLNEEVPTHACTMGIASIMRSKKILVIATGANKAEAVYHMVKGNVEELWPASVLQKHDDVIVILDKDAASQL